MGTSIARLPLLALMGLVVGCGGGGGGGGSGLSADAEQRAYVKASNPEEGDGFGASVSIWGDTMVVGAPGEDSNATGVGGNQADDSEKNSGAAYVFVRAGTTWTQQAYLKASNTERNDAFGTSVSISGDTIVIGAPGEDGPVFAPSAQCGAAYVFVRTGTTWTEQALLRASNADDNDLFGSAVSISGDTVVVASPYESSDATGVDGDQANDLASGSGAAYAFARTGTVWTQQAYLKASNTESFDRFGSSAAISGSTIVVGARDESGGATGVNGDATDDSAPFSGAAYVFVRTGTTWAPQAYLKASNTGSDDQFGSAVSISGATILVGAPRENSGATGVDGDESDNSATSSGAAYVFTRSGTTWTQEAYLKASNTDADDAFGVSVAISGDGLVVGADGEASVATGVDGDASDDSAAHSGAAYAFVRSGTTWSPRAYMKASNTQTNDSFGVAVATSSDTVVVGAADEDSVAPGIDGDELDESADGAGAVYAFR